MFSLRERKIFGIHGSLAASSAQTFRRSLTQRESVRTVRASSYRDTNQASSPCLRIFTTGLSRRSRAKYGNGSRLKAALAQGTFVRTGCGCGALMARSGRGAGREAER